MAEAQANIGIGVDTTQALAAIRQLQREISAFHTSMAKGGALANVESARLSQNLINSINATGKFSAGMSKIQSSTESFTNSLEKNKFSMGQYFRFAGGASKSFGKFFSKEFATINQVATERVKDLQTQFISMGRDASGALQSIKVRPLALDMDNLGTKVMLTAQKQQIFNQLLKQGTTNLLNFGKNTQWAGRQLMVGFTIPLTIFGGLAAKEFQKLEEQAVKFKRVYGDMFTTDADTQKALKDVRALADEFTKYGIAVEKTIGLAAKVAQMGNVGTALTEQVTQATRLAILGGMEQEEALETTISLTNAFGVATEDLAGKIAFLNAAENQTILAIEDFTTAIPLAGSVVRQLGGDVEDLAALLTAMREGGINAAQAGNALKSSLGRLIAPSRNAKEVLGGFGIDVMGIVENNAGNLMGTINTLAVSLNNLDPLSRARAIEALFGKFQFARMSTLFSNIIRDGSQASRVLDLATNSMQELSVIAERELRRVEESPAFKLQKQMEQLKASLAPIGEEFVKAVGPLIEFGTRILKSFNNLGDGGKQFIVILTTIAGVVAPALLMGFGLIANGVANLLKFFHFLGGMFGRLSGQSKILGGSTEYLTQEQIEAAAVAASLGQSHSNLIQIFTAEAGAINALTNAYRQATLAQAGFRGATGTPAGGASTSRYNPFMPPAPRQLAEGILSIPGPKGAGDVVPAMLSPGEAVIPAEKASKYSGFIKSILADKVPGFAKGVFLGMPTPFAKVAQGRADSAQIASKFVMDPSVPLTMYGHQIAPTTGRSFPIPGVGGAYATLDGLQNVFVKPFVDKGTALAEMRAGQIARMAHGLLAPQHKMVRILDPTDPTKQRNFYALESKLDPVFASPTGKFTGPQMIKQLLASLLRADKDLSPGNMFGNVLTDPGPAGVYTRASGYREMAQPGELPSLEEQAKINLLGVKGGARKFFAQATSGIARGMTPDQYHQGMIKEITRVLPKLRSTIASFGLEPGEQLIYDDMIKRLEMGLATDWRPFHTMHSAVPGLPPSPPRIPGFADGKPVPGYSKGVLTVPGRTADGDAQPAMLTAGEAVISEPMTRKYGGLINAMIADNIPGYAFGTGEVETAAKGIASRIMIPGTTGKSAESITSTISKRIDSAMRNFGLSLEDATKKVSSSFKSIESSSIGTAKALTETAEDIELRAGSQKSKKQELHSDTGVRGAAKDFAGKMGSSSAGKLIDKIAHVNPEANLNLKSGFTRAGSAYANSKLSADQSMGLPAQEGLDDYNTFGGVEKYNEAIKFGGGDLSDQKLVQSFTDYDNKMRELQEQAINRKENAVKFFVDTEADIDKLIADERISESQRSEYASYESFDQEASQVLSPEAAAVRDRAKNTAKTVRYKASAADIAKAQEMANSGDSVAQEFLRDYSRGGIPTAGVGRERSFGKGGQELPDDVSFQDGVGDANAYNDGVESAAPADVSDIARRLAGRQSPHPEAFPDGADDAKEYLKGQESVLGPDSDPYKKGSPLAPPPPPPPPPVAPPSRGKKIADRLLDSGPSKAVGKFLAKQSGNAVTDSKGNVFYDPNEDMSTWAGKQTAKQKEFMSKLPGGSENIAGGVTPVRVVNNVDLNPQVGEGLENVQASSDQLAGTIENQQDSLNQNTNVVQDQAKQDKQILKESKRQSRQTRSMRGLMGLGTLTMAAGMATQVEGVVGETAQKIVGPLGALSGILPVLMSLPAPIAALVAVVGLGVAAFMAYNKIVTEAREKAQKLTEALGTGSKALQKFADFTGKARPSEIRDKQRLEKQTPFHIKPGKTPFGQAFLEQETGQELLSSVRGMIDFRGMDAAKRALTQQLQAALIEGSLTQEQARGIALALGQELGDLNFAMDVNANLLNIFGPNGENLETEPLSYAIQLNAELTADALEAGANLADLTDQYDGFGPLKMLNPQVAKDTVDGFIEEVGKVGPWLESNVPAWAFTSAAGWIIGAGAYVTAAIKGAITGGTKGAKETAEAVGTNTALITGLMQSYANNLDAIDIRYDKLIDGAKLDKNLDLVNTLIRQKLDAQREYLEDYQKQIGLIQEQFSGYEIGLQEDIIKNLDESIVKKFEDDPIQKALATSALKGLDAQGLDKEQEFLIKAQVDAGNISISTLQALANGDAVTSAYFVDIIAKIGGKDADFAMQLASGFGDDDAAKQQFLLEISTANATEANKTIDLFNTVNKMRGVMGSDSEILMNATLRLKTEDPAGYADLMGDLDYLNSLEDGTVITTTMITEHVGEDVASIIAKNQEYFDSLPPDQQKNYAVALRTMFTSYTDPAFQDMVVGWAVANKGARGSEASIFGAHVADYMAFMANLITVGTAVAPVDEDPKDTGSAGAEPQLDSLLKKLRDLRIATIDLKKGWKGMQQVLQTVFQGGENPLKVFDGLSNQIRNFDVGENLIEMIVGMDPDEYNKHKKDLFVFDKAGNIVSVTAKLKNMQAAFNAIALGEYVNEQQRSLATMNDQISAISVLTSNGLSLAEAYDMVQDEALAAALAMGASSEEIKEIIRLTEEVDSIRKDVEKEQEGADASKAVRKTNEEFEKRVAVIKKLSKAVGQYTDAQIDAIMGDSNLQTLFLEPSIDQGAMDQAIFDASRNAEIELKVRLATTKGKAGVFEEGFSKAMETFSVQEQTIDLKFRAGTVDDESVMRAAESQIAGLQFQLDDYQAEITRIEDQEQDINDAYEKRFEALDKIAQANEDIAAAQKSQLDIADALTRGDIAGAARAVQEARSQQADRASKSEKEQLERARDAQLEGLTGRDGLNREQIESRIGDLQKEIFNIEEDLLEPAQERVRLAQALRDEQVRSLMVLGKTREEWEQIKNNVDAAQVNNWEFIEGMETALEIVDKLIEELNRAKPLPPPPPPPPAPSSGGSEGTPKSQWVDSKTGKTLEQLAAAQGMYWADYYNAQRRQGEMLDFRLSPTRADGGLIRMADGGMIIPKRMAMGGDVKGYPMGGLIPYAAGGAVGKYAMGGDVKGYPMGGLIPYAAGGAVGKYAMGGMATKSRSGPPLQMAMGGKVKGYPMGGLIPYKANGGFFKSLGSDTVPAMLTPGEFVVRRPAVRGFGVENLEKINRGTYNDGSVYNYNLAVNVKSNSDPDRIARTVMKHIERVDSQKIRGNKL